MVGASGHVYVRHQISNFQSLEWCHVCAAEEVFSKLSCACLDVGFQWGIIMGFLGSRDQAEQA